MRVTLIDSPVANIASIRRALIEAGAEVELSSDPETIARSRKLVLPGVGTFAAAAAWLRSSGNGEAIRAAVANGSKLLGICVGHQLLFESSSEIEDTEGIALCTGRVTKLDTPLAVPQVGWNAVEHYGSVLFDGVPSGTPFYFVHSYAVTSTPVASAWSEYGCRFVAAIESEQTFGLQFHPEKSSTAGLRVLSNYIAL